METRMFHLTTYMAVFIDTWVLEFQNTDSFDLKFDKSKCKGLTCGQCSFISFAGIGELFVREARINQSKNIQFAPDWSRTAVWYRTPIDIISGTFLSRVNID